MFFLDRADRFFRLQTPKITAIIVIFATVVPFHIPGIANFIPLFNIMMVYYWTIYRPSLFPVWFIFLLGLMQDALYGVPLGVHSFLNLVTWMIIVKNRRYFSKESFLEIWLNFCMVSLLIAVLNWIMFCLLESNLLAPTNAILQWLLSAVLYACIHYILNLVYSMLPDRLPHSHA